MDILQYAAFKKMAGGTGESSGGNSGNSGGAGISKAFIDVLELPTSSIQTGVFYRMPVGTFAVWNSAAQNTTCYCVNGLPTVGEPVTNAEVTTMVAYYDLSNGTIHGYVDDTVSAVVGIPAGWYGEELFDAFGVVYGGVITNMSECIDDGTYFLLLTWRMYFYDNGWCEVPFCYEIPPAFDIQWDGVIGDKFALDMTAANQGIESYFVKVSDRVFSAEELIGATYTQTIGTSTIITEDLIDSEWYTGALVIDSGGLAIVYDADVFNTGIGAPAGYVTNGTYFVYMPNNSVYGEVYTDRLVAPSKVAKIDAKYLDESRMVDIAETTVTNMANGIYQNVYTKSEVDQKIANAGGNVDLSGYAKKSDLSSYAKTSDVDALESQIGDISAALDELHAYAQSKIGGGEEA